MATDIIARALAANGGGGGEPVDAYTKAETNDLLANKADKNTSYTKTEVNNLLAEKEDNILSFDTWAEYNAVKDSIPADTYFVVKEDEQENPIPSHNSLMNRDANECHPINAITGLQAELDKKTDATDTDVLKARMDQLVGTVPPGSADEIADARVMVDGKTSQNLGDAIRTQVTSLKETIAPLFEMQNIEITKREKFFYQRGEKYNSQYIQSCGYDVTGINKVRIKVKTTQYYDAYTVVDADGNALSYRYASTVEDVEDDVIIPDNAQYVYLSGNNIAGAVVSAYIPANLADIEELKSRVSTIQDTVTDARKRIDALVTYGDFCDRKYDEGGYYFYVKGEKVTSNYINSLIYNLNTEKIIRVNLVGSKYYDYYNFVDNDGNSIEYVRCENEGEIHEADLVVPDGATKLVLSGNTDNLANSKVYFYRDASELEFVTEQMPCYICKYWYQNANKQETPTYYSSSEINCSGFSKVFISGTVGAYTNYFTFLDADKNVMSYKRVGSTPMTLNDFELIVPDGAVYCNVSATNGITLKATYPRSIKNANTIFDNTTLNNPFHNTKIYWLGTSIPAGGGDGQTSFYTYPKLIAKRLNADVTNLAVGSSPIHARRSSLVTADNPYGFIDSFQAASRCLTNTVEMCNWIIDNYTHFSDAPSSLSESDKEFIRSCSYENRIIPKLTEPCIWILDHGFNDFMGDEEDYSNDDKFNTFTFRGACNFIIDLILSKQPKSAIYMVGVTTYGIRKAQADNQIVVAEDWNLPFIKLWDYLGWTEKQITTTGGWVDGVWNDNAFPSGHTLTMREIALPDGIHPHTDTTLGALNQISMILAKWISEQGYYDPISADDFINYWNK